MTAWERVSWVLIGTQCGAVLASFIVDEPLLRHVFLGLSTVCMGAAVANGVCAIIHYHQMDRMGGAR